MALLVAGPYQGPPISHPLSQLPVVPNVRCQMNILMWLFHNTGLESLWQAWGQYQAVGSRNLLKF